MWSCRPLSAAELGRSRWWPIPGPRWGTRPRAVQQSTGAAAARGPGKAAGRRETGRAVKAVLTTDEAVRKKDGSFVGGSGCDGEWSSKAEQPLGEFLAIVTKEAVTHSALCGQPSTAVASAIEMAARGLLDLGFSQDQFCSLLRSSPPVLLPSASQAHAGILSITQTAVSSLRTLLVLGLSQATCVRAVMHQPQLAHTDAVIIQSRARALRRHGLGEGWLEHVVSLAPELLVQPEREITACLITLRNDCLFSGKQSQEIARTTPRALLHTPYHLQFTFQYAYFRMGMSHAEMVSTRLFGADDRRVRTRHQFLERRGLFSLERTGPHATPDPRGPFQPGLGSSKNPKPVDIIHLPDGAFLKKIANKASHEELEVFSRLLAQEELEEESQKGEDSENEFEVEVDEVRDNSDSDSEEESGGKRRRKP